VTNDDGSKSTMEVNRFFWLTKELAIDKVLGTVSVMFSNLQKAKIKSTNIVIGFFDTLIRNKHFDADDTALRLDSKRNIKSIYGEKNLNFSRVAVPVDKFSGDARIGGTKKTFNPETIYNEDGTVKVPGDLTLNSASIVVYSESFTDEDASSASCEIEVTADGTVIDIISFKNMERPVVQRNEPGPAQTQAAVNIQMKLHKEYTGIGPTYPPLYLEETNEGYVLGQIQGGNRVTDLTTDRQSPLWQVKYTSTTGETPVLRDFKIKIEYSLVGG